MQTDSISLRTWADKIEEIVREASKIILNASQDEMRSEYKSSLKDLVTKYDVEVQVFIEGRLAKAFPDMGFLGEESGASDIDGYDYIFIVDPIDGTSNFVANYKHSGISVALAKQDGDLVTPVIGVVYNPYLDEMFTAIKGEGTRLNGVLYTTPDVELDDSLILFGTSPYNRELARPTFQIMEELYHMSRDLRRGGAAVLDISYVAVGRRALFFESQLQVWDYAAAALIVEESGGVITDLYGNPLTYKNLSGILAGNKENHNRGLAVIKKYLDA